MRHGSSTTLRVLVLGGQAVGKSAVTVRFLTRRFIGEYNSTIDLVYRSAIRHDDIETDVEILDWSSHKGDNYIPADRQMNWADAFVIVYSICDRSSFYWAKMLIDLIRRMPSYLPVLVIANKRDLECHRTVDIAEGHHLALQHGCQYYEVSAADSHVSINIAFHSLLREAKLVQQHRTPSLKRRKSSLISVSKKLGAMFGKITKDNNEVEKKRGTI
ncbi:ras-related and estrogen-regulated growth inhibitor-like protein [Liolophura sinensis]|uniref:ras-related and estrogen-regulated growth inhibitor-like protein n=1 Tax=Liolophura sinensis TaxID=3198878 RepID=UPI00315911F7